MTQPLTEAARALENAGLQRALNAVEERDAAMRAALAPLEDLQRISRLVTDSPLLREMTA